ncbi:twin-arginine translocase subunit TatB [Sphingomonas mali]|uniref:twin-arginine translocase subunit TatB n=1 Tax=Sphingomonas mali TaxID=40682 RepID=UPI000AABF4C6
MILDIAPTELLVLGGVALLVIPPKDLPRAMRFAGQWVGKARGLARQFRSGFDDMIREAEFAEMEKKWKAENERIMREFPQTVDMAALMAPKPQDATGSDVYSDPGPVMVEQPAIAAEPESAAPEPAPAPAPKPAVRKSRAKATAQMSLDTFEPAAPKPRARRSKAAASPESPDE